MSAELGWPLAIFGTAAVWVAITVLADRVRRRRARRRPTLWEENHRQRQLDIEITESKPNIWNH